MVQVLYEDSALRNDCVGPRQVPNPGQVQPQALSLISLLCKLELWFSLTGHLGISNALPILDGRINGRFLYFKFAFMH